MFQAHCRNCSWFISYVSPKRHISWDSVEGLDYLFCFKNGFWLLGGKQWPRAFEIWETQAPTSADHISEFRTWGLIASSAKVFFRFPANSFRISDRKKIQYSPPPGWKSSHRSNPAAVPAGGEECGERAAGHRGRRVPETRGRHLQGHPVRDPAGRRGGHQPERWEVKGGRR